MAGSRSHDPADNPRVALTDDRLAPVDHLALEDYDFGGYSIGGRIVARMLARGARPDRAVIGGTGLDPILHAAGRGDSYRHLLADYGAGNRGRPPRCPVGHRRPAAIVAFLRD
jgi:hypothetical protein